MDQRSAGARCSGVHDCGLHNAQSCPACLNRVWCVPRPLSIAAPPRGRPVPQPTASDLQSRAMLQAPRPIGSQTVNTYLEKLGLYYSWRNGTDPQRQLLPPCLRRHVGHGSCGGAATGHALETASATPAPALGRGAQRQWVAGAAARSARQQDRQGSCTGARRGRTGRGRGQAHAAPCTAPPAHPGYTPAAPLSLASTVRDAAAAPRPSAHLLPQALCDGLHRALGGAVEAAALRPVRDAVPREPHHVDDVAPPPAPPHVLGGAPAAVQRQCGCQRGGVRQEVGAGGGWTQVELRRGVSAGVGGALR